MIAIFPKMFKIELIDTNPGEESILVLSQVWKFLVHYYLETDNPLEYDKWRFFHLWRYAFYYPMIYDSGICTILNCIGVVIQRNPGNDKIRNITGTCFLSPSFSSLIIDFAFSLKENHHTMFFIISPLAHASCMFKSQECVCIITRTFWT